LRSVSLFVFLLIFWLLLSGRFDVRHSNDVFLTACGVGSCLFVTWLARRKFDILDDEGHPIQLGLRAFTYVPWLLGQIALSNWDVFKRVWNPALPIDPCVIRVPFDTKSDLGTVIYANSITLTPGTVTISVDKDKRELLVHCLTPGAGDDLREGGAGGMLSRVKKFEGGA